MPRFKYVARDVKGEKVQDEIEAANQAAAMQLLRRQHLSVLSLTVAKKSFLKNLNKPKPRAKANDLVVFTRQFSTMVEAGLPVVEILDILLEQTDDPRFKLAVQDVRADVRGGSDLSSALAKFPNVFIPLYSNLIKAGEASGDLDVILKRLATYLEKNAALIRKIKSAMVYPCVSLGLIFCITLFLLCFIVPQFEEMFDQLGAELPAPTRAVLFISNTLTAQWYIPLTIIAGLIVVYVLAKKSIRGRYIMDSMKLKMPVLGDIFQKVAVSRFARTFSTMLRSGVPMLGSLDIVASTAGNGVVEEAVLASREAVRQGESLATPLSLCPVFPPMVVRMITVGERTGAIESLLEKVADFYDEQVDAAVESMTALIEPLMIGIMGLVVGSIVIAIFLPIIELSQQI